MKFSEVTSKGGPLQASTLEAVAAMGFDDMTPVQAAAIPLFLNKMDVSAEARRGAARVTGGRGDAHTHTPLRCRPSRAPARRSRS